MRPIDAISLWNVLIIYTLVVPFLSQEATSYLRKWHLENYY